MKSNVEIEGLDSWKSWADSVASNFETRVNDEVEKSGSNVQRAAKFNVPVDTGDLRKSLTKDMESRGVNPITEVFSLLPYADDVEIGTSKQRPQPYLFPAFNQEIPILENKLKQIARSELG